MSFVGLYTGLSGVRAAQTGIDLASHNVANAATPGYTRQRVNLVQGNTYDSPVGKLGTGVTVADIGRLRDTFLDQRARNAFGDHGAASVRSQLLTTVEALTSEPDSGVSKALTRLWTAAEAWANDPAEPATRRQVLSELTAVGETVRSVAGQWDVLATDVGLDRDAQLTDANAALRSLAELDHRIVNSLADRVGADLFDQRDLLLDEVAHLTGADVRIGGDGRTEVRLGGVDLITMDGASQLSLDADGAVVATAPGGDSQPVGAALSGTLGGLTRFLDQDLPKVRGELNDLAAGLADAINAINTGGVTADGSAGQALIEYDAADPAGTLRLVTEDLAALAAASGGTPPAPHDSSNARKLADLRTTAIPFGTAPDTRDATVDTQLSDLLTGLAGEVRSSRNTADGAKAVAAAAGVARDAEHSVSIDEEMVELIRHQRALEAAARVMTTIDQTLDVLVNRVGIVGR